MAAHRYWRILFTAGAASNEIDLGWVKFFDTVDIDGTTVAASTGGTAISGENYSASYLPAKSFTYTNAEQGDLWASTNNAATWGTTKWIGYDFASSPKDIVAYGFIPYSTTYAPSAWKFQYSDDGSSWTDVHTVTGWGWQFTNIEIFRVPSTIAGSGYRYWRVYQSGTGSGGSIGELSLRTTVGGSNVLSSLYSSLTMDSCEGATWSAYGPRKALDANTGFLSYTSRPTAASTSPHWWMVDFGKKLLLAQAVMTNGTMAETRGSVKVQASNDLSTWVDFGEFPAFTADYQSRTLPLVAPTTGLLMRRRPVIVSC
jgi:hypothetical protein